MCVSVSAVALAHPGDGIVVAPDGTIYFTDVGRKIIWKLSPDGTLSPAARDRWTHGLLLAADGTLYYEREVQRGDAFPASFWKMTPDGEQVRLIVVDTEWTEEDEERDPLVLLNPELSEHDGKVLWKEGCLSVPEFEAEVERAERVVMRATDLDGKDLELHAEGLQAVCFQHEVDHLDGILFIDRISHLKRSRYVAKRKKQLKRDAEDEDPEA